MNQLIKITDTNGKQVVSAKELYDFLEFNPSQWSRWYKKNIEKNPFGREGQDWIGFDTMSNGNTSKDFALSIDFAERLSMMARTSKGEEIRLFFISCKNQLHAPKTEAEKLLEAFTILHKQVEHGKEQLRLAENTIKIQAPKVKYVNEVLDSNSTHTTTTIAKELGMGAPTLNSTLHKRGVLYKHGNTWVLYQKYHGKGYTKTKTYTYEDSEGKTQTSIQTVWTEKGRRFIHSILNPQLA